jgi:two-component system sensor histidine kinase/response regulator
VLIVDDNATSREILSAFAISWGMRPTAVEGGPWALEALYRAREENDPFRVAVIDFHMPGMDGEALGFAIQSGQASRGYANGAINLPGSLAWQAEPEEIGLQPAA